MEEQNKLLVASKPVIMDDGRNGQGGSTCSPQAAPKIG